MAIDFTHPTTSDNYSTVFVPSIVNNFVGLGQMLDSIQAATLTGTIPTYTKRYNRTNTLFDEYNGTIWSEMPLAYIKQAGGTMTGLLRQNLADGIRLANDSAMLSGYNTAYGTRTGYLQFNTASSVILRSEGTASLILGSAGGDITIAASGAVGLTKQIALTKAGSTIIGSSHIEIIDTTGPNNARAGWSVTTNGVYFNAGGSTVNPFFAWINNDGSSEHMRLDASGNLGIGGTPVGAKLEVFGGARISNSSVASTGVGLELLWDGTNSVVQSYSRTGGTYQPLTLGGSNIYFYAGGGEKGRFLSTGQFLVNRTADSGLGNLQISGTSEIIDFIGSSTTRARIRSSTTSSSALLLQNSTSGTATGAGLEIALQADGTTGTITAPSSLGWYTGGALRLTIDSSGSITSNSSGAIANWGSTTVAGSFSRYYKGGTTTTVGYIGTDGGAIVGGGTGLDWGIRAEGNLLLLSAGGTYQAYLSSSGDFRIGGASAGRLGAQINTPGTTVFQASNLGANTTFMVANLTNGSDADCNIYLSGVGAGSKFATIGSNTNVPVYFQTNGSVRMIISTAGLITDVSGNELGFKGLPLASITSGAFVATDRGKCVYATAGVTIPNSTMTAGDVVIIQNTTASAITITKTITTAYNCNTAAALGATFTLAARGRAAILFESGTVCSVAGNIS